MSPHGKAPSRSGYPKYLNLHVSLNSSCARFISGELKICRNVFGSTYGLRLFAFEHKKHEIVLTLGFLIR